MAYRPSVSSVTRMSTVAAQGADLTSSMFASTHAYFKTRSMPFYSMEDVNASGIPTYSNTYKALQQAFSQVGGTSPIYVGRREIDAVTFTPTVKDNDTYTIDFAVYDTTTGADEGEWQIQAVGGAPADATAIVTALKDAFDVLVGVNLDVTAAGTFTLTPQANKQVVIKSSTENLVQSFTVSENAATMYAAIEDEINENFYFVTSEERDLTFVLDLAAAVQATENSDYKKQYRVSSNAMDTLTVKTDPAAADDLLGQLFDKELTRVMGEWHDQSDEIFPELSACVKVGGYFAGSVNWKFLQGTAPSARHPVLGRLLNKAEQGYIRDRNASWVGQERKVSFMHGGTNAIGTSHWSDLVQIKDWVDDQIEVRVLTALLNANNAGRPLKMTKADLAIVKERVESVLIEGVERGLFQSFDPVQVPDTISFSDQSDRILRDVTYNAYFAAKINFAIIEGNLTYREELA
ncbi:hypothetical protein KUA24_53 [Vibrio phage HNL01]|nr:hypothetical protein KUA24_53 [Vibrio phage HNL01]